MRQPGCIIIIIILRIITSFIIEGTATVILSFGLRLGRLGTGCNITLK
jgi:hypothetical protein